MLLRLQSGLTYQLVIRINEFQIAWRL
jgi:hypothetical protein